MKSQSYEPRIDTSGIRLGRLLGIPVVLDWSLFLSAALVTVTLGLGAFRSLHPDWSAFTVWAISAMAAFGLFAAIYLHELGHALVAKHYGIKTEKITLFILGGMAQLAEEPRSWRAEFWIAVAGPIVSIVLGGALLLLVALTIPSEISSTETGSFESFFSSLSPMTSLLLWLGNINIALALFNFLPAFPLDGGRVVRALLWASSGQLVRATRWAGAAGRFFGYVFIGVGVFMALGIEVPLFGSGIKGLWLVFVGWFLTHSAKTSVDATEWNEAMRGIAIAQLTQDRFATASSLTNIQQLMDEVLFPMGQRSAVITDERGAFTGLVTTSDVAKVPRADWRSTPVAAVMTPVANLVMVTDQDSSDDAARTLRMHPFEQLPIVDAQHRCVGLLTKNQLRRWFSLTRK